MNGAAPHLDDAFAAYRQQLGKTVQEAVEQGQTYEERWNMVRERMERWALEVNALVHSLQHSVERERGYEQVREQAQEMTR